MLTFPFKGVFFIVLPVWVVVAGNCFHQVKVLWSRFWRCDQRKDNYQNADDDVDICVACGCHDAINDV